MEKTPTPEGTSQREARTDAMMNGGLISLGALAIIDNVVAHWLLDLHRAVPGPHALVVEIVLVVIGASMLAVGILREKRARAQESCDQADFLQGRGELVSINAGRPNAFGKPYCWLPL